MNKKNFLKVILVVSLIKFTIAFLTWHPDVFNHMDWGIRFFEYGPQEFYKANVWSFTWPNQPPGTVYLFAAVRRLFEIIFSFFWWINVSIALFPSMIITYFESNLYPGLLKLPAILADLGIAYLIYKLLHENGFKKYATTAGIIFIINPVIWYNSSVWGQYDSVINFLALLAAYLLINRRLISSIIIFALSIYIKASLLIFAPIFFIFALRQGYRIKDWSVAIVSSAFIIGLMTYPFADKNVFVWLFELYKDKIFVNQLQVITANAFNLWAFLTGIHERPHSEMLGPLTYQAWGTIAFAISYFPAVYLIIKKQNIKSLFWALTIAAFSSFMLLTNMHERYLYPLFIPFTVLLSYNKNLLKLYIVVSIINLINLYNFWWTPRIELFINLLSAYDRLLPRILGLLNFGIFIYLYRRFLRQNSLTKL